MAETELLPCPRCGAVPRLCHDHHAVEGDRYWTICECRTDWKLPLAEAIAESNRRTPPSTAEASAALETGKRTNYRGGRSVNIEDWPAGTKPTPPLDEKALERATEALLSHRGFGYYTDPMEGGQDAFDITNAAREEIRLNAAMANTAAYRLGKVVSETTRGGGDYIDYGLRLCRLLDERGFSLSPKEPTESPAPSQEGVSEGDGSPAEDSGPV